MSSTQKPRWATIAQAARYLSEHAGEPVPGNTLRRWAADGRIRSRRIGPRKVQIDLDDLDAMLAPVSPIRWQDDELAREIAASLLPLTDEQ